MRLLGTVEQPLPLMAVLEVSGAVLSWIVDDPAGADAADISFTDPTRADWLWRVIGESGHVALLSAVQEPRAVTAFDIAPGAMGSLHRLALGHWLRRWWPASQRDGIPALDRALLDVEVALLTVEAQAFFSDETLDSDVAQLLAPHAAALIGLAHTDDGRVRDLVRDGAELADELGLDGAGWAELSVAVQDSTLVPTMPTGYRDDYALAAGAQPGPRPGVAIGRGVASINWGAVPPGIFDAAEDTVDWSVEAAGPGVVAVVRAAVIGPDPATDVAVRLRSGDVSGAAAMDAAGRATVPLVDTQRGELTESAAWNHDWPATSVDIGAPISAASETREARDRVRAWVRARLDQPPADAYLAEVLASESSY
ncbi:MULTISPECIES: hypothetical protein [Mycobacterium]|uniref:Uncharacterized protein n=1 Tax=Mycobacterium gordonae TaxID=1778 RepID=A0A1X1WNH9_MYCGO|nr:MULTISPECIES: hypothetical protein [Mycobacterium]MBI2699787.1 hypothetical protein [Mycobacterium sp.]MCV7007805.1 hypothetical protein [Mycobacterium gordonae]ODR23848.1 hypothetical protein BHQ23_03045 [Mycobacterium gordonae]ORV88167.1 hypothetical protein AWC08_22695 [Mycobacterium gordonae]PJE05606.1 MAG: hypothetical protein CK429_29570 [Mycobacterium sp.]